MRIVSPALRAMIGLLAVGAVTGISADSFAARRSGVPSDGAPFPPNSYANYDYFNGTVVYNAFTGAAINWDLPAPVDSSGFKDAKVVTRGNHGVGVKCWGVTISPSNGATTVGSSDTGSPGCGVVSTVNVPSVNVLNVGGDPGSMLITCQLPFSGTVCAQGRSAILQYRHTL